MALDVVQKLLAQMRRLRQILLDYCGIEMMRSMYLPGSRIPLQQPYKFVVPALHHTNLYPAGKSKEPGAMPKTAKRRATIKPTMNEFHRFPKLPAEIKIQIWKFAFLLGVGRAHGRMCVCKGSDVASLASKMKQPMDPVLAWFGAYRAYGWNQRNFWVCGLSLKQIRGEEHYQLCPNYCCFQTKCSKTFSSCSNQGSNTYFSLQGAASFGEDTDSKYRIVVPEDSDLRRLLQTSILSRLSVLELWIDMAASRTAHQAEKRRKSNKRRRRGTSREAKLRTTKHEMMLDVVQKLLEQCRLRLKPVVESSKA